MLEHYYTLPKYVSLLRTGPSAPHLDSFAEALYAKGYSAGTGAYYLRTAVHLGHFLQRRRTDLPLWFRPHWIRSFAICRDADVRSQAARR